MTSPRPLNRHHTLRPGVGTFWAHQPCRTTRLEEEHRSRVISSPALLPRVPTPSTFRRLRRRPALITQAPYLHCARYPFAHPAHLRLRPQWRPPTTQASGPSPRAQQTAPATHTRNLATFSRQHTTVGTARRVTATTTAEWQGNGHCRPGGQGIARKVLSWSRPWSDGKAQGRSRRQAAFAAWYEPKGGQSES